MKTRSDESVFVILAGLVLLLGTFVAGLGTLRSIRLEEEKTEQIRMILELEKMRGTQMEKGTLGKKSAEKTEVEF